MNCSISFLPYWKCLIPISKKWYRHSLTLIGFWVEQQWTETPLLNGRNNAEAIKGNQYCTKPRELSQMRQSYEIAHLYSGVLLLEKSLARSKGISSATVTELLKKEASQSLWWRLLMDTDLVWIHLSTFWRKRIMVKRDLWHNTAITTNWMRGPSIHGKNSNRQIKLKDLIVKTLPGFWTMTVKK